MDTGISLARNEKELVYQISNYFKDFKVTEYDLRTPTSIFVIDFYKSFLTEFFVDVNSIMQVSCCFFKLITFLCLHLKKLFTYILLKYFIIVLLD